MNIYTTNFTAACPNDGFPIEYKLKIESEEMIMCEEISEKLDKYAMDPIYQEAIADELFRKLGCHRLLLFGTHAGIDVASIRP